MSDNSADQIVKQSAVRVWGLAAGRGTTKDAVRGAFTWQEYRDRASIPRRDWRRILIIEAAAR